MKFIVPQNLPDLLDDLPGFIGGDVAGAEIVHGFPAVPGTQSDEVAAEGYIFRVQLDPHGRGLERSAAGKVAGRVITENGEVGHVASRRHSLWNRPGQTASARFRKPVFNTEFGADTIAGFHTDPPQMWSEEYQAEFLRGYLEVAARKDFVIGMHVWNFADFQAVQSIQRVGGMNLKGVFTRTRTPKLAAHVLRELWSRPPVPAAPAPAPSAADSPAPGSIQEGGIQSLLEGVARRVDGKKPALTTTLKFDLGPDGIYRMVIVRGAVQFIAGDGEAAATLTARADTLLKVFHGRLDPRVAVLTGRIKLKGDIKAFVVLQEL
jgi:hypothetical protein